MTVVRPAAVADRFYPGDPVELRATIAHMIDEVRRRLIGDEPVPRALIVPHAGYVYSGPIAAAGYARLLPARKRFRRVVLLGPAHYVPVDGIATSSADAFETPLGPIPIDVEAVRDLNRLLYVHVEDAAHAPEHSLEVHLPFLQTVLDDFTLLPLAVGRASAEEVADVIRRTWTGDDTLLIISSDLSHFHDAATAQRLDSATARCIERLDDRDLRGDRACGYAPISGLLRFSKERGFGVRNVDLRNSGDTGGPRDRVVGYGAFVVEEGKGEPVTAVEDENALSEAGEFTPDERRTLLEVVRWAIRTGLDTGTPIPPAPRSYPPHLREPRATFVTLRIGGELRGCMGALQATRPLIEDVAHNAFQAAFRDPRFRPLSREEFAHLEYHVSVLDDSEPIRGETEDEIVSRLRPGLDGLIVVEGNRRGTLLPSVWDAIADPRTFLRQVKKKAGLPETYWSPTLAVYRYGAESFGS